MIVRLQLINFTTLVVIESYNLDVKKGENIMFSPLLYLNEIITA